MTLWTVLKRWLGTDWVDVYHCAVMAEHLGYRSERVLVVQRNGRGRRRAYLEAIDGSRCVVSLRYAEKFGLLNQSEPPASGMVHYSPSARAFFIWNPPPDAIPESEWSLSHRELLEGQAQGKMIVTGVTGAPVLREIAEEPK